VSHDKWKRWEVDIISTKESVVVLMRSGSLSITDQNEYANTQVSVARNRRVRAAPN